MKQRIVRSQEFASQGGKYVLYWMQQAQRVHFNFALDYAIAEAASRKLPLIIAFVISDAIPQAEPKHFRFMLEGICELAAELQREKADFRIYAGDPVQIIGKLARDASLLVLDHGYLKWQRAWREAIFERLESTNIVELDTEAVVPVHIASHKEEYSAATLRRKLLKILPDYLSFTQPSRPYPAMVAGGALLKDQFTGDLANFGELWSFAKKTLHLPDVEAYPQFTGGYCAAQKKLREFKAQKLVHYSEFRNHPELDIQSDISPYLHFGQISALDLICQVKDDEDAFDLRALIADRKTLEGAQLNLADWLEELIVRRELSMNFCSYNEHYDNFASLPAWAKATLLNHLHDPRERGYTLSDLENAATTDVYWNAAQMQMVKSGKMHNYMRMYWGKRVLAWFDNVEEAYEVLLHLNNKHELDGRGANAYAGVAWCFGKHDRPWAQRPIYGMVRYMNDKGLKRKFNMPSYLRKVANGELQ